MRKATLLKTLLLLCTLIVWGRAWADTYVKVTRASELVEGDVYIIATSTAIATAFSTTDKGLTMIKTGFTESSGIITTTTASPMEFVLDVTEDRKCTFKNGTKYLGYANATIKSYLRFEEKTNSDLQEQWTIVDNATYGFVIKSAHTPGRFIGASTNVFRAYNTMSANTPANLYKKCLTEEISSAGWRTYAPAYPVRFREGIKAYIVSAEENDTEATLTQVTSVPANTPVLLNGEAGTHTMDVVTGATSDVSGNCLHVSNGTNPDGDMYVLANVDNKLAFYLWDKTEGGSLPAEKIYLQLNNSPSARPFIALPGEKTGIDDVKREAAITNNRYYDLQGRHVPLPTKGLYIVNGRKVMIK